MPARTAETMHRSAPSASRTSTNWRNQRFSVAAFGVSPGNGRTGKRGGRPAISRGNGSQTLIERAENPRFNLDDPAAGLQQAWTAAEASDYNHTAVHLPWIREQAVALIEMGQSEHRLELELPTAHDRRRFEIKLESHGST